MSVLGAFRDDVSFCFQLFGGDFKGLVCSSVAHVGSGHVLESDARCFRCFS